VKIISSIFFLILGMWHGRPHPIPFRPTYSKIQDPPLHHSYIIITEQIASCMRIGLM